MVNTRLCPTCGHVIEVYKNPLPAADVAVVKDGRILLISRLNPPHGWALPGGFIEYGESADEAARRELKEETGLCADALELLGVYSKPDRDPRFHTITIVYLAPASGLVKAGDDAADAQWFDLHNPPSPLAFDHDQVIRDIIQRLEARSNI